MKNNKLFAGYVGISGVYMLLLLSDQETAIWYMKPFLVPLLISGLLLITSFPSQKTLLAALVFSWVGDVVLLFTDRGEIYFILGLVAFLISHILYSSLFICQEKRQIDHKSKILFGGGILLIITYLTLLIFTLLPNLGGLALPVSIYALVISTMLLFALKGFFSWKKPANTYIFLGAVLFVISDSILAFNKFYASVLYGSFLIMLTYLAAQYLIVVGIVKLNKAQF